METQPKFNKGDRVHVVDGDKVLYKGEIWCVGEYDSYCEQWRYHFMEEGTRHKKWWNENSLRLISLELS